MAVATPDAVSASRPALVARESQFDFGPISMAAGKVSHRYWIHNESADPLTIKGISTSRGAFSSPNYDGFGRVARDNNSLYLLVWFLF